MSHRSKHLILQWLLGKPFFIAYFLLGIIFFALVPFVVPGSSLNNSFFVALALMTGSDPYSITQPPLQQHQALWYLSWLIHIASWLLIPALVSLVISDAAEELQRMEDLHHAIDELIARLNPRWNLTQQEIAALRELVIDLIDREMEQLVRKEFTE